jgi:hypothetical protein
MSRAVTAVVALVGMLPVLYISSCTVIAQVHDHDFAHVKVGDTEPHVIAAMGSPSDEERAGSRRVPQYGAPECASPCVRRLWYLNRLSLVGEAWEIDLDGQGRVVRAASIASP